MYITRKKTITPRIQFWLSDIRQIALLLKQQQNSLSITLKFPP